MEKSRITKRSENYSQWYLDVIREADLAENSIVRGCMVIKPNGYAIWEKVQEILGGMIKDTGHENAYFPLFIPKSLMSREAEHVKGFAKECAIVTHHRLKDTGNGVDVDPDSALEEEVIVRPTSETIMYETFAKWVKSYRDLPIMINQWANIVRWEMRTRLFLRTTEFLWQEGHTAHATAQEAEDEAIRMLNVYKDFVENYMAIPVVVGRKSDSEKFPGAKHTYTMEAMMQDGKSLQAGTSHNLSDHFSKAFDITYLDKDNERKNVWQTSWGLSTRIIGGLIMTHSDDKGLVLPPKIASTQVVIIPIWKTDEEKDLVLNKAKELKELLGKENVSVKIDDRDYVTPGFKFNEWEKKGIPVRVEVGPRDVKSEQVISCRRDTSEKITMQNKTAVIEIKGLLEAMQKDLFKTAEERLNTQVYDVNTYEEFKEVIKKKPGFVRAFWNEDPKIEEKIKEETGATTRCLPLGSVEEDGKCIFSGEPAKYRWLFGISY